MTDYQAREAFIVEQAFNATSATKKHDLGTIVRAYDTASGYGAGEFIYLEGVASQLAQDWCTYTLDNGRAARMAGSAVGPVCIAMSANVASQFGWYQISGKAVGFCNTAFADNGIVYFHSTSTGGAQVDDTSLIGDLIFNAIGASAATVGAYVADFEIHRPFMLNRVNPVANS